VGLLIRLLSRPQDWHFHIKELADSCGCSKDLISRLFKELITAGYLVKRVLPRGEKAQFKGVEWDVYDSPQRGIQIILPHPDLPGPVAPAPVDQDIQKKEPTKERTYKTPSLSLPQEPAKAVSKEAIQLAEYLLQKIRAHSPQLKEPNLSKWESEIDLMMRRDKREADEIYKAIDWATADHFWHQQILSAKSLRDNYDKLTVRRIASQMKEATDDNRDFARAHIKKYRDTYRNAKFIPDGIQNENTGVVVRFDLPYHAFAQALPDAFMTANGYAR
jgi:hypothetical protein